jgi:7-keto-8-aminopelargonate synthetase-like enzyme
VKGQEIYEKNRAMLKKNIARFSENLPRFKRVQTFEGYPVFSVKDENLADELFERGVLLSSFPYPSLTSPKVTRIVLNSLHRDEDIDHLLSCL